jgi:pimeloyl-ACP methyl ester carboxylesterase
MKKAAGKLDILRFEIPYRLYGDSENLIVCLSGAKQTMSAWRGFVSRFQHDYSILVFDLPGQGRSQIRSGSAGVSLSEQVDVLHILLDRLDVSSYSRCFLVGGSWGSIVAASYLDRYPGMFQKAILGSFGTKPNAVLKGIIDKVQAYIEQGRGAELAPLMIDKFGQLIPDHLKRQIISQFNAMTDQQFASFYEHSKSVTEMGDLKHYVNLESISIPVLVVMGQFDTIMDLFDTRNATELLKKGEFRLVKGVGHFLHWEKPELFELYEEYLNRSEVASHRIGAS